MISLISESEASSSILGSTTPVKFSLFCIMARYLFKVILSCVFSFFSLSTAIWFSDHFRKNSLAWLLRLVDVFLQLGDENVHVDFPLLGRDAELRRREMDRLHLVLHLPVVGV
uniref:Uncharacterized protein n=1 Tax=Euplotes harpa TaxID=151035 RepID=A0A7S3N4J4_9SPIT